ncbi:hypothetical protein Mgra_00000572 [Meloidogyne graminicola]|uniref:SPRY domain-containing protein n=1 Tax=Meloidogyne graminicola TaxID=189291 RepID=A0A8T0A427_9BILA|nr:hypothetical protein Mgra_00000572 [Meloidogyne graminicola]
MSDNISNSTSNLSTSETDCCCSIECCKSCIKMQKTIASQKEKIDELTLELEQFRCKGTEKLARFVLIPNKISNVDSLKICCEDNCLKKDLLYASCASTNGYVNVRYDGKIRYYLAKEKGKNNLIMTYSQNSFNKKDCYSKRYSLFYFEVKMVKETDKQCNAILGFDTKTVGIFLCNDNSKWDDYQKFNWKDGDVFGCGAIFQPNERSHTIVFFTKNGQKIGKNNWIFLAAQNQFTREKCYYLRYSLFYYEVKMIKETDKQCHASIGFDANPAKIFLCNDDAAWPHCPKLSWKNGDVFGCGVIFQPNKPSSTIAFFTKNGEKIGNKILLEIDALYPLIGLSACSVEVNFGYDLALKPFIYDVKTHLKLFIFHKMSYESDVIYSWGSTEPKCCCPIQCCCQKMIKMEAKLKKENENLKVKNLDLTEAIWKLHLGQATTLAHFVLIPNKIISINETSTCCDKKCINTNLITGTCKFKYGYVNVRYDGKLKYFLSEELIDKNNWIRLYAQNAFTREKCYYKRYSLFYYEVKMIKETDKLCWTFSISFFKGNQILLEEIDKLIPTIDLKAISVEVNFGYDLETKPFIYDARSKLKAELEEYRSKKLALFVYIPNKLTDIYYSVEKNTCCENKCINKDLNKGFCVSKNGYINVRNDGTINIICLKEKPNEKSYIIVFFTKNGKKIGNNIFLEEIDELLPCIGLDAISVEVNFGYDLVTKPFIYDVNKHFC